MVGGGRTGGGMYYYGDKKIIPSFRLTQKDKGWAYDN